MANTHSLDLESSSSQYASITDAAQTGLDITGDLTIEAWVKPETIVGETRYIATKSGSSGDFGYEFFIGSDSSIRARVSGNGSTNIEVATADSLSLTGVWTHLAFVYSASSSLTIYINGVQSAQNTTSIPASINDAAVDFRIGSQSVSSDSFDGLIDEVRVWNDVRTATEIQDNLGKELVGNEANLQGYWKLNNDYTDETSNGNDLTASGSPVFSTDVPFEELTEISGSYLETNLQGYWTLNEESGTRADSTANGNDLTDNNTVGFGTGKQGNAADFEESNSEYLSITDANQTGLDITADMTVSAWVKPESSTTGCIIAKTQDTNGAKGFRVVLLSSGVNLFISDNGSNEDITSHSYTFSDGTWYHIVLSYDASAGTSNLYVDGVLESTDSTAPTSIFDTAADFAIGREGSSSTRYFDGLIDEVGVWNKVLTFGEVQDLYAQGNAIPFSAGISFEVSDTLSLSETFTPLRTRLFSIAENLSLVEGVSALKGIAFSVADTLGLVEAYQYSMTMLFNIAENLGLIEYIKVKKPWTNSTKNIATGISNTVKNTATNIKNRVKS